MMRQIPFDEAREKIKEAENEENLDKPNRWIVGILGFIVPAITLIIILTCFDMDSVQVTGNKHYTEEQIKNIVLENERMNNVLILYLKNKIKPIKDIPFIDSFDVEYISSHAITITVYEKAMAGCVEYMNQYIYFDQDGIVLEMSTRKMEDVPCITGISFSSMELHAKLPIEDERRFKLILNMTQLIEQYELSIDDIHFTGDDEIIMNYQNIKILLGKGEDIEDKLIDLGSILEKLKGKKGTLNMKDFTVEKGNASFKEE